MDVQHKQEGKKGRFYIETNGEVVAKMTYSIPSENKILIDHTEVNDDLRGKNIGNQLVHAGVEYARKNKLKIIAVCSFAKGVIEKKADWQDVLDETA